MGGVGREEGEESGERKSRRPKERDAGRGEGKNSWPLLFFYAVSSFLAINKMICMYI